MTEELKPTKEDMEKWVKKYNECEHSAAIHFYDKFLETETKYYKLLEFLKNKIMHLCDYGRLQLFRCPACEVKKFLQEIGEQER